MERDWKTQCAELSGADPEKKSDETPFNLVIPRSQCPQCGHKITALENIPIISYLFLRGKCSECGTRISPRYPAVEVLTALLSCIVAWHFGFGWETLAALTLTWALIALTAIDFEHQLLPDSIIYPFLWLGLLLSLSSLFVDSHTAIIGAAAGYLSLWFFFHVFKLLTGKEGMGYGDFKLFALFGAWMGWHALPLILILSSVVGAITGIALMVLRGHERNVPIPFGPYLAAAGWIALLWGEDITNLYLRWSGLSL